MAQPEQVARHVARGGTANIVGSAVSALAGFGLTIVVARGFTSTQAGAFFTITSLFLILVAVSEFGADSALSRFIPVLRERGKPELRRTVLMLANVPSILIGGLLAAASVIWRDGFARLVGQSPENVGLTLLLIMLGLAVPFTTVGNNQLAATRGLFTIRPTVWIDRLGRPLLQLLGVAVAATVGSITLGVGLWLLPMALAFVPLSFIVRRLMAPPVPHRPRVETVRELGREYYVYAWPRAVARTLTMLLQRLDVIVVAAVLTPGNAAVYAVATRLIVLAQLIGSAIQQVLGPRLAALIEADEIDTAMAVSRISAGWTMLAAWPICLASITMGRVLLGILGGADYLHGSTALAILGAGLMVGSACGPVDTVLLMAGRSGLSLFATSVAVTLNVILLLWWTPLFGIDGASAAWAVAIVVRNTLGLFLVKHMTGETTFGAPALAAAVATVIPYGLLIWLLDLNERSLGPGLAGLAAVTLVYAGLVWWMRKPLVLSAFSAVRRRSSAIRKSPQCDSR